MHDAPPAVPSPPYTSLDAAPVLLRRRVIILLGVFGCVLAVLLVVTSGLNLGALVTGAVAAAQAARQARPIETAIAAVGLYAAWIVAFLPTTLPELAMGFVFGLRDGYFIDLAGKLLGAFISYELGRSALRACVHRVLLGSGGGEVLHIIAGEASARPYATSLLLRAAYVPMPLKNYGLAVLGVERAPFTAALLPLELVDTYVPVALGASAKDLAALLRGELPPGASRDGAWLHLALVGVAALATAALLAAVGTVTKRAIDDARRRRAETPSEVV